MSLFIYLAIWKVIENNCTITPQLTGLICLFAFLCSVKYQTDFTAVIKIVVSCSSHLTEWIKLCNMRCVLRAEQVYCTRSTLDPDCEGMRWDSHSDALTLPRSVTWKSHSDWLSSGYSILIWGLYMNISIRTELSAGLQTVCKLLVMWSWCCVLTGEFLCVREVLRHWLGVHFIFWILICHDFSSSLKMALGSCFKSSEVDVNALFLL